MIGRWVLTVGVVGGHEGGEGVAEVHAVVADLRGRGSRRVPLLRNL